MTTLFVTASGTEVGKTYVACRLAESLARHYRLRVVKPVASGFNAADVGASDTGALLRAQGAEPTADAIDRTTPWRFEAPLSPDMAAARERREIPFDALIEFCREGSAELTIVEGIGGALVPLDAKRTVLDWMCALRPTVLLVAGSYLGSISHTLATCRAIEAAGLNVAGIVLSESPSPAAPLDEIAEVLRRFSAGAPVLMLSRPASRSQLETLMAFAASLTGLGDPARAGESSPE